MGKRNNNTRWNQEDQRLQLKEQSQRISSLEFQLSGVLLELEMVEQEKQQLQEQLDDNNFPPEVLRREIKRLEDENKALQIQVAHKKRELTHQKHSNKEQEYALQETITKLNLRNTALRYLEKKDQRRKGCLEEKKKKIEEQEKNNMALIMRISQLEELLNQAKEAHEESELRIQVMQEDYDKLHKEHKADIFQRYPTQPFIADPDWQSILANQYES